MVFPTETFYGLGCRVDDPVATARVVDAKGRRPGNPFPVIAANREQAESLWTEVPAWARRLIDAFWPGPLTLVLPARPGLPPEVAGSGEIGVRVSPNPFAQELARRAGPLVATSANRSGDPEVTTVADLDAAIRAAADAVVDGGPTPGGRPSTVVAVVQGALKVLREGPIQGEKILEVAGVGPAFR